MRFTNIPFPFGACHCRFECCLSPCPGSRTYRFLSKCLPIASLLRLSIVCKENQLTLYSGFAAAMTRNCYVSRPFTQVSFLGQRDNTISLDCGSEKDKITLYRKFLKTSVQGLMGDARRMPSLAEAKGLKTGGSNPAPGSLEADNARLVIEDASQCKRGGGRRTQTAVAALCCRSCSFFKRNLTPLASFPLTLHITYPHGAWLLQLEPGSNLQAKFLARIALPLPSHPSCLCLACAANDESSCRIRCLHGFCMCELCYQVQVRDSK